MKWFAEHALLPSGPAEAVLFEETDGRFTAMTAGARPDGATVIAGLTVPGFANCHSHAFHRALRGRTSAGAGTFWTWREQMYAIAARLDPDSYLALARSTYAEMALAGITSVGEFHYLHHAPGGVPYAHPNAMAHALEQAAADAGIRLTLLDTAYLAGGLDAGGHLPLDEVQQRFADRDVDAWSARVDALQPTTPRMRVGVAAHSVRAVPREALTVVAAVAAGRPLHVHLSEQPAENDACQAFYGRTPTALLDEAGILGPDTTAVHATHLTGHDIAALGRTRTTACFCPTTERDLADGIGPARALLDAGALLSLGSDQHAVIDLLEEARALEMDERLASGQRGWFTPTDLLDALTRHESIGWDAGQLAVGARADLVGVRLDSVRTAGAAPDQALLAATAADVHTVVVDGRIVVEGGRHILGDVGSLLQQAIEPLWREAQRR